MMEVEYTKSKRAYEEYNLNSEYGITEKVLSYIEERIKENKEEISKMLKIYNRECTYEEIEKTIKEEIEKGIEYKKQINIKKREDGFVSAVYMTSIGIVAVESYDVIESIKYMIRGIKTRNAIIISDIEYEEKDDKGLILLIIREALKKYGINENLIQIVPYEECEYEKCDKVIYTYEEKENKKRKENEKIYVYIESEELRREGEDEYKKEKEKGEEVEIIEGEIEEVIEKLNREINKGVVIYTTEPKKGYKFINLVRSKNVFVNATLLNKEKIEKSKNELLMNKKIMYELV